jgi:hypothetical protein
VSETVEGGLDALVRDGLATVDAAGVDAQQDVHAMSGTVCDVRRWDAGVESKGYSRVP